jgi:hypothetical protein
MSTAPALSAKIEGLAEAETISATRAGGNRHTTACLGMLPKLQAPYGFSRNRHCQGGYRDMQGFGGLEGAGHLVAARAGDRCCRFTPCDLGQ